MVNTYSTDFFAKCPTNGVRIAYRLKIETRDVVAVEEIIEFVESVRLGFHEDIADSLFAKFGGLQTLTADHHGVTIETKRTK